jgi:hypothetical protein
MSDHQPKGKQITSNFKNMYMASTIIDMSIDRIH